MAPVSERRLSFGEVAELYDRARPSYPDSLVEDVIELSGAGAALEVGAGTGKATVLFAERGVSVLALEPSAEMAQVARRNCARYSEVSLRQIEFEHWQPGGERFPLIYSAQAWHWVTPHQRYTRARAALKDGGLLAPFWNRIEWESCDLGDALRAAYDRSGVDQAEGDPMDPRTRASVGQREWWMGEIEGADAFEEPEVRAYCWTQAYSADEYVALLRTHSSQLVLESGQRDVLLRFVAQAIAADGGGRIRVPYVTQLCMARATGKDPSVVEV